MFLLRLVVVFVSVSESASSGDRLAALEAVRDRLAGMLDETDDVRAVASLVAQLRMTLAEIAELSKGRGAKSGLDELLERRASRSKPLRDGKVRDA